MAENKEPEWIKVTHKKETKPKDRVAVVKQQKTSVVETPWYHPPAVVPKKQESQQKPPKSLKFSGPNSGKSLNVAQYQRKIEKIADGDEDVSAKRTYPEEFRKKIIAKRTSLGLTQKEFAFKFNVKECLIKGIENGTEGYDPSVIIKLSNELQKLEKS